MLQPPPLCRGVGTVGGGGGVGPLIEPTAILRGLVAAPPPARILAPPPTLYAFVKQQPPPSVLTTPLLPHHHLMTASSTLCPPTIPGTAGNRKVVNVLLLWLPPIEIAFLSPVASIVVKIYFHLYLSRPYWLMLYYC